MKSQPKAKAQKKSGGATKARAKKVVAAAKAKVSKVKTRAKSAVASTKNKVKTKAKRAAKKPTDLLTEVKDTAVGIVRSAERAVAKVARNVAHAIK